MPRALFGKEKAPFDNCNKRLQKQCDGESVHRGYSSLDHLMSIVFLRITGSSLHLTESF
jgi:hypothetical protein